MTEAAPPKWLERNVRLVMGNGSAGLKLDLALLAALGWVQLLVDCVLLLENSARARFIIHVTSSVCGQNTTKKLGAP